jgi:acetamidase/formamidase
MHRRTFNTKSTDDTIYSFDQVNGPIYIRDAEMIDIKIADWGRTAITLGFGLLHEEFPQAKLKIILDIYGSNKIKYVFHFDHLPMNGNIDTKYFTKEAKLYLSVECKGA